MCNNSFKLANRGSEINAVATKIIHVSNAIHIPGGPFSSTFPSAFLAVLKKVCV
jgi:hypothetical protein